VLLYHIVIGGSKSFFISIEFYSEKTLDFFWEIADKKAMLRLTISYCYPNETAGDAPILSALADSQNECPLFLLKGK
jgi:hypothetical protein